jgi:hypothetical protein
MEASGTRISWDQGTGHSEGSTAWGINGPCVSSLKALVSTSCQGNELAPRHEVGVHIALRVKAQEKDLERLHGTVHKASADENGDVAGGPRGPVAPW